MPKKNRSSNQHRRNTPLSGHQKNKKTLIPPFANLGSELKPVHSRRDILPELLWIDAVLDTYEWQIAVNILHSVLDIADKNVASENDYVDGTISSFQEVSESSRSAFMSKLDEEGLLDLAFPESFRHALSLYHKCPMSWLIEDWQQQFHADPERGIGYLKAAILRLYDTQSQYTTRCRMIPLARMMKNGKFHFTYDSEMIRLLPKYPRGLTEEEQALAESFVRATANSIEGFREKDKAWPKYFWHHNFEISMCETLENDNEFLSQQELVDTLKQLQRAIRNMQLIIQDVVMRIQIDLYEPDKEDVLFGLISRQFRLFTDLSLTPGLWKPELGRSIHRLMLDTQILVRWLIHRNDQTLFRRFKEYSLGKQKLHKLHVEELIDTGKLPTDYEKLVEVLTISINEEIFEEFLVIDYGALFPGTDARKMAEEVGLKEQYDIGYHPLSAVIHGEWVSLKDFYLTKCLNPLHRFHWLPNVRYSNELQLSVIDTGAAILVDTIRSWASLYSLEVPDKKLEEFLGAIVTAISA